MIECQKFSVAYIKEEFCLFQADEKRGRLEHIATVFERGLAYSIATFLNDRERHLNSLKGKPEREKVHAEIKVSKGAVAEAEALLTSSHLAVLRLLRGHVSGNNLVSMSYGDICDILNLNKGSVQTAIARIIQLGLAMIAQPSGANTPATYQLAGDQLINTGGEQANA